MAAETLSAVLKTCTLCGVAKPLSEYSPSGPYLRSRCKPCRSRVVCEWARQNPDVHNARLRRWRAQNPEKASAPGRAYYRRNKEAKRERTRRSRERTRRASPPWTDRVAIGEFYKLADTLTAATGVRHEVDHIVPIAGRGICGLHVHWNLRVVPWRENRSKGNKLLEAA